MIRGGENIYPREIEEFLRSHPKISDVAVYGVPHRKLGEEVAAAIRLKQGESATPEEIMETVSELVHLALAAGDKVREEKEQYISQFDDESFRNLLHYESDKSEQAAMQRLRDAGIDVPHEIDLSKPYSSLPDLQEPDHSDFYGTDKVVIDPWKQFGNE